MRMQEPAAGNGFSEVLQMFDNIYLPEWKVICATFIINDIRSFAELVLNLFGERPSLAMQPLADWSRQLEQACQDFAVMQIAGLLPAFPGLVKDLATADRDLLRSYECD